MARKGRIYVPVESDTRAALERLAQAQGSSMARVAGEQLDALRPQFLILAQAIEMARTDPEGAARMLERLAEQTTGDLFTALDELPATQGTES